MKKLAFLLVVLMLVSPALALEPDTTWVGLGYAGGPGGDGVSYLDPDNWDNGVPVIAEAGYTTATTHAYIMNGDTVTIDDVGAIAGRGRKKRLYVGHGGQGMYPPGDGHVLLVPGGEITGVAWLGNDGRTGTVTQTGGNWLCRGDDGISYGDSRLVVGSTGYGKYELIAGNLGGVPGSDMGNDEWGLGRLSIGLNSEGEFIQHAGTYVQCRGSYFVKLAGNTGGQGTYTMHGGTLRANGFYFSLYGGNDYSMYAKWNITSTDVDIVLGSQREGPYSDNRCTGVQLGYNTGESAVRCYWSAPEGDPGETVQIEIIGGLFINRMRGVDGRDADVDGLNNITIKFSQNPDTGWAHPFSTFEVAGKDMGDDYHGLCNNFALEGLIVGGAAGGVDSTYLNIVDDYDSMIDGADNEVLYVESLTINTGSWLLLKGKTVYYYKNTGSPLVENVNYMLEGGALVELTPISGDANMDVVVDDSDLSLLLSNFGDPGSWGEGDFNDDGNVDDSDLSLLLSNFGEDACTAASTVPEPATLTLLGLGALALIRRRRQ